MKIRALPLLFGRAVRRIHAVGAGGMGVGPLAIHLARRGWSVSAEDDTMNPAMAAPLRRAGVELTVAGALPADVDLVVVSSAIVASHPTRLAAQQRGVPVERRGRVLAEVARDRRLIGVCGSHGKTSVTAMIIAGLRAAGMDAGWVLGGLFADDRWEPAAAGEGEWLVAEIDESDGTIAAFSPAFTLVVNLDWDHPDHYAAPAELERAFAALIARTTEAVVGWDGCAATVRLLGERAGAARAATFGRTGDYRLEAIAAESDGLALTLGGRFELGAAKVRTRGDFNALNATAALAVLREAGVPLRGDLLAEFPGVRRRQALLWQGAALTVMEDYAHHPAEIRALLQSLRRDLGAGERLVVVFQPHRFSRTLQFKAEFAAALAAADTLHLLDVYGAGEAPRPGGTTADLYAELGRMAPRLPVNYLPGDAAGVLTLLRQSRRPGDQVIFVGAGDIEKHARNWVAEVRRAVERAEQWDEVAEALRAVVPPPGRVAREEPLAAKTTLRVGGAARVYVEPAAVEALQAVVKTVKARALPLLLLGRGSNLLIPDAGVDAVVVSLRNPVWESFEPLPDGRIRVGAGLRLKALCGLATKAGRAGFEFLEGIPGNVGGALRMNAGAMGGWMFDVVEEVEVLTADGERQVWPRASLHVGYRHCAELAEAIAIAAVLRPAEAGASDDAVAISRQIETYREKRQESQPREPSAGCIFKNPEGDSAGRLIDVCGLKGERIGDAEVSSVHGNFIINRGAASSAEIIELVRRVRRAVEQRTGVVLQPEVLLYGGAWEEVL